LLEGQLIAVCDCGIFGVLRLAAHRRFTYQSLDKSLCCRPALRRKGFPQVVIEQSPALATACGIATLAFLPPTVAHLELLLIEACSYSQNGQV